MKYRIFAAVFAALSCLSFVAPLVTSVAAHEGHDHSQPPPALAGVTLSPRMEARTADFELVAAVENGALVVWLDRAASNQPVSDVTIEVEGGAVKGAMNRVPEGADVTYTLPAPALATPGDYPLVFAITSPDGGDLLNGTLTIPAPAATPVPVTGTVPAPTLLMAAALAVGLGIAWLYRHKGLRRTS